MTENGERQRICEYRTMFGTAPEGMSGEIVNWLGLRKEPFYCPEDCTKDRDFIMGPRGNSRLGVKGSLCPLGVAIPAVDGE